MPRAVKEAEPRNNSWMLDQRIAAAITGKPNPTYELLLTSVAKWATLEQLQMVATGGVDNALLQQMIQQAVDNLDLSDAGLSQAEVQALVDAAVVPLLPRGDFQSLLNALAGKGGGTVADAGSWVASVKAALTNLADNITALGTSKADKAALDTLTGDVRTLETSKADQSDFTALETEFHALAQMIAVLPPELLAGNLTGTLTPEQTAQIAEALNLAQGVVNVLGGKPEGGGTLADVAAVFDNLGQTFAAQIEQATVEANANVQALVDAICMKPDSTVEEVTAMFQQMGQAVLQGIQSAMKALPEKITLNVKSANAFDKVVIESWQLTPHPPTEARGVDVDITPYGEGKLLVKGKRVLTVDDALATAGSGIDQAAIEAAVTAATAPLLARIAALEEEQKKFVYTEYMQEQFGNFNDLLSADIGGVTQLALAEQKKLQELMDALVGASDAPGTPAKVGGFANWVRNELKDDAEAIFNLKNGKADKATLQAFMDVIAGRKDATLTHVEQSWQGYVDTLQEVVNQFNQTVSEVIDYVVNEYATKKELGDVTQAANLYSQTVAQQAAGVVMAELQTVKDGLDTFQQQVGDAVNQLIAEGFEAEIPKMLEALSLHLENVLSIFTSGGTPGQVVTPAQLTQLLADIARDYATKDQVTAALAPYAKKDDGDQEITAKVVTTRGVIFSITDEALAPVEYDEYGTRLSVIPKNATSIDEAGIVIVHNDLTDLLPGAKSE